MAETRFIRTVVFGGYDKGDVDKKFDYIYKLFFENKNKLREAKLLLEKMKDGTSEQDALESVLAAERAKLTEVQVKNENLVEKVRSLGDENSRKDKEIQALKAKLEETEKQLGEAQAKLVSEGGANSGAMLNVIFQQAQASSDLIINTAKKQADDLSTDSRKLAENTVTDANNKAKTIIYEAETKAAEITAAAETKAAAMDVASGNVKAAALSDVEKMSIELAKFKAVFEDFRTAGTEMITKSQEMLDGAVVSLTNGGIPTFKVPEVFEPELAERPTFDDIDDTYATGSDDDMVTGDDFGLDSKSDEKDASGGGEQGGNKKVSLADLAKKAKNMK